MPLTRLLPALKPVPPIMPAPVLPMLSAIELVSVDEPHLEIGLSVHGNIHCPLSPPPDPDREPVGQSPLSASASFAKSIDQW